MVSLSIHKRLTVKADKIKMDIEKPARDFIHNNNLLENWLKTKFCTNNVDYKSINGKQKNERSTCTCCRKFIFYTIGIIAIIYLILFMSYTLSDPTNQSEEHRGQIYLLKTKKSTYDTSLEGQGPIEKISLFGGKTYDNPWQTWRLFKPYEILLWKRKYIPDSEKEFNKNLEKEMKMYQIDKRVNSTEYYYNYDHNKNAIKKMLESPKQGQLKSTWFGHSTVLIQFSSGFNCLIDPMFSKRASPLQLIGPARKVDLPFHIKDLRKRGIQIHAIFISHNHHDHLDTNSIEQLKKHYPNAKYYVPEGINRETLKMKPDKCTELNWWGTTTHNHNGSIIDITLIPAQHWSQRALFDQRTSLWGGVVMKSNSHDESFYYAGDTGYCQVFKEVGKKFNDLTVAFIPIGAYLPRWFMNPQHNSPQEAVQMFKDIGCKNAFGVHWLTFELADDIGTQAVKELELFKIKENGTKNIENFVVSPVGITKIFK